MTTENGNGQPLGRHSRPYVIHSSTECDRLEKQASLADLPRHLNYFSVPVKAHILDAGCGSGSMARLLASTHSDATVVGVDINADYIAYARERAAQENLVNVEFRIGDIFDLPFPDSHFDLVWSKYLLHWLKEPKLAVAEFRRVTKPGGQVVCANVDGFAVTHWPVDPALQPALEKVFPLLVDPFSGRKTPEMFRENGLWNIEVDCESDRVFTVVGSIDPARRENWVHQFTAGRPYGAKILGSQAAADTLADAFLAYQDRPDTCSYTTLYFIRGTVP